MMIEIIGVGDLNGGNEYTCYFAKGHVDKQEFVQAVKRDMESDVPVEKVRHTYFRCVPLRDGGSYYDLAVRSRGAFPVTLIDLI